MENTNVKCLTVNNIINIIRLKALNFYLEYCDNQMFLRLNPMWVDLKLTQYLYTVGCDDIDTICNIVTEYLGFNDEEHECLKSFVRNNESRIMTSIASAQMLAFSIFNELFCDYYPEENLNFILEEISDYPEAFLGRFQV